PPGADRSGVADPIWQQRSTSPFPTPPSSTATGGPPAHVTVKVRSLPAPTEGEPIPAGQNLWILRPDNSIRDVWTSPTEHHFVFAKPSQRPRFDEIVRERDSLFRNLPDRGPNSQLLLRFN